MNDSKPSRSTERPDAPAGRDPSAAARTTPSSQPTGDSAGSRAGSTQGTASERTGLGDGTVQDSSQGLTGAQSGGGDRRPARAPMRSPADAPHEDTDGARAPTAVHSAASSEQFSSSNGQPKRLPAPRRVPLSRSADFLPINGMDDHTVDPDRWTPPLQ